MCLITKVHTLPLKHDDLLYIRVYRHLFLVQTLVRVYVLERLHNKIMTGNYRSTLFVALFTLGKTRLLYMLF